MIEPPNMIEFPATRLVGSRVRTSFVNDRTSELWRGFRVVRPTIAGRVGGESYSVKVYDASYSFSQFDPAAEFEKWAAVAVGDDADAPRTFGYIFGQWLPASPYELDLRPHFEILPEGYDPFDDNATERVLIPIRTQSS